MVDAARNTAWDLGKQPNNYRSNYPTQEWARRFVPIASFYSILFSDLTHVKSGVPQQSDVDPLLFIRYINDLYVAMTRKINPFENDTKLCHASLTETDKMTIQSDLNHLFNEPKQDVGTDPETNFAINPGLDPTTTSARDPYTLPAADPSTLPAADPSTLPAANPSTLPAANPSTLPAANPATDPTTLPAIDPSTLPATDPSTLLATDPSTLLATDPARTQNPSQTSHKPWQGPRSVLHRPSPSCAHTDLFHHRPHRARSAN
ncbi:hypothetical protein FHG87_002073 [Trinorchestia longiramus]|nr:hypothetical protein FHG87_002073 [Trinorchestia longiramus]